MAIESWWDWSKSTKVSTNDQIRFISKNLIYDNIFVNTKRIFTKWFFCFCFSPSILCSENSTQNHFTHWEIWLNSLLSNIQMRILHFSPDAMFFRRNISPPQMLLSFRICLNAKYSKQLAMRHRHRCAHICLVRYISCHDRSGVAESVHEICCCLI